MKKIYSQEFKMKVVKIFQANRNVKNILNKYKISRSTLYEWLKLYNPMEENQLITYKDYLKIKQQLEKKTRELEIIEKTHSFKDSPRQQKLEAIEKLFGQYSVREMCRIIDLPHGTFYNYYFRRVLETQNEKNKIIYREAILRIFEESCQRFSSNKIYHKMRTEGFKVDYKTVSALFKEMGLKSKHRNKRTFFQKEGRAYNFIKNKLNRQFNPAEPNKFWVSDTTNIWVNKTRFHLCVIIELFSRKIIAYRLSSQDNFKLIINTFKDAFESRGCPTNLTFNSDKGNGYISNEFRSLLRSLKITQSCSKSGNPYDNAVVESFFASLKREELNSQNFEYFDELKDCVNKYMEYYNDYRPHESLKTKLPTK